MSARTAPCPRSPASGSAPSRSSPRPAPSSARGATSARPTAARRACRAALGTAASFARGGAQVAQERVRVELAAERRRTAVAGVDDRVGAEAVEERADRVEQRLPVAAGKVDAADGTREEDVAREERAVGMERDVTRTMARGVDDVERDPRDLDRVA